MSTVLVATDLSPKSDNVVENALAMTRRFNSPVHILHVVEQFSEEDRRDLEGILETRYTAGCSDRDNRISGHILSGDLAAAVFAYATESDVSLVVLAATSEEREWFSGLFKSESERIAQKCDCAMLVSIARHGQSYDRVVAGIDFSVASREALELAMRLVPMAEFHLFHAYQESSPGMTKSAASSAESIPELHAGFRKTLSGQMSIFINSLQRPDGVTGTQLIKRGFDEALATELSRVKPGMLAVGGGHRSGLSKFLGGGIVSRLIDKPPVDLLIV